MYWLHHRIRARRTLAISARAALQPFPPEAFDLASMAASAQGAASQGVVQLMPADHELVGLARRAPQPKKTSNPVEGSEAMQRHSAFKASIGTLSRQLDHFLPLHGHLLNIIKKKHEDSLNEELFVDAGSFSKMDSDRIMKFIVAHSKLSVQKLVQLKLADPDALRRMFVFGRPWSWTAKLPEAMKTKAVIWKFLKNRPTECGDRWAKLDDEKFFRAVRSAGWSLGCYRFVFAELNASELIHCPGEKVVVPSWEVTTNAFPVSDNHDDAAAQAALQGTSHSLKSFFGANVGPNSYKVFTPKAARFKEEIFRIAAECEMDKKRMAETSCQATGQKKDVWSEMHTSAARKRKEAAARAREVLESKKENLCKQSGVNLS